MAVELLVAERDAIAGVGVAVLAASLAHCYDKGSRGQRLDGSLVTKSRCDQDNHIYYTSLR